ncbi:MAG TPA: UDP-3-O-(3-hydroxymyristoyl)glucosamine N-acyltransferase, partial [Dissulfurispiraceae bacterium]
MKLNDISRIIDGEVLGDGETEIAGVSGFSGAKEGDITFLAEDKWLRQVKDSKASAVVVKDFSETLQKPQVKVRNPQYAFAKLLSHFYVKSHPYKGVSKNAFVSERALLGQNVSVYDFAYISDNVTIGSGSVIYPGVFLGEGSALGERCLLYPNVTIREGVRIGNDVIIHAGAVVGSDGFAYVFEGGVHHKIPHIGGVIIEDNVEIGANAAIDRATTEDTIIRSGTKIDNLVQIAHNV